MFHPSAKSRFKILFALGGVDVGNSWPFFVKYALNVKFVEVVIQIIKSVHTSSQKRNWSKISLQEKKIVASHCPSSHLFYKKSGKCKQFDKSCIHQSSYFLQQLWKTSINFKASPSWWIESHKINHLFFSFLKKTLQIPFFSNFLENNCDHVVQSDMRPQ